ncbi:sulfate/molybdate ABC transporter ATP-binding protein [uncultured Selenomonas sp.]|uniref:sulfate/molybdate ABC transporter ATP-binding protein n=1 Tax=uncultured Selenomonas sp. TaxID=159275 RepID=UPI002582832B|nr:ATP-binding cassette domain-containing protein [uncultured Selenomonas sp.]
MELMVKIEKRLRDFTLRAEFTLHDDIMALLGASGSGKSMTLKCIAGLEQPDAGRIVLNGRTLYDSAVGINLPPQARRVGYLFQNYALFPHMTVWENILFALSGTRAEKERALRENIERFSLSGLEEAYPEQLSGGQQQRVAFARILARGADLLLLDEPLSALDTHLRWRIETALRELLRAQELTAILVTHDCDEAFRIAEQIAVLAGGVVMPPREKHAVFRDPRTRAAAVLTGCQNISRAVRQADGSIEAIDWGVRLPASLGEGRADISYIALRAHYLALVERGETGACAARVMEIIESAFSYIALLRFTAEAKKEVRFILDKAAGEDAAMALLAAYETQAPLYVRFPVEKLMVLQA